MNLLLHDMNETHVADVLRIEQQAQFSPWTVGNFSDALREGDISKVLELDGKIIGFAVMRLGVDDAELLDIAVEPGHRRKGYGRIMLQRMLDLARTAGKQRVILEVRVSNVTAQVLYEKVGFAKIGLRPDYYAAENGREDAILMGYEL